LKYINTDTSPLEILVITSPYFNGFYEYYGGNVSNLYYDLSLNTPQLNVFFTGVHDRLEIFINELKNLKSDLGTQSGKDRIRMDRNNYFSRVLKGEVLIEENLLSNNGRDHLQYIETLGNVLLNLNEIQNIDEILILVPDLKYANRNLITKADLSLNSAFVQKLLVVAKKVFETFISGDEQLKTSYSDIMILLSTLGLTGKLDLNDKSTVNVEFNPRALVKYLNGVKIGQPSESVDDILVKHPYGYEI